MPRNCTLRTEFVFLTVFACQALALSGLPIHLSAAKGGGGQSGSPVLAAASEPMPAFAASESAAGTFTEFPLPTPGSQPTNIYSFGGRLYVTESGNSAVGVVQFRNSPNATSGGNGARPELWPGLFTFFEWLLPPGGNSQGIAWDGTNYFTTDAYHNILAIFDANGNLIGQDGAGLIGQDGAGLGQIVSDNGAGFGFAMFNSNTMGIISDNSEGVTGLGPLDARARTYKLVQIPTPNSGPASVVFGPDGAYWFCELNGNKIGRMTTAGVITEYAIPTASSGLNQITVRTGRRPLVHRVLHKQDRADHDGRSRHHEFTVPTAPSGPNGSTTGSDGAIWFTEDNFSKIGRMTTAGAFTEYTVPTASSRPLRITTGPDGAIYFTEFASNKIGRFTLSPALPTRRPSVSTTAASRVTTQWKTSNGQTGAGQAVSLTGDTGYFWFFNSANVELVIKALDACGLTPSRYWVFAGGLTDVNVVLTVADTQTGASGNTRTCKEPPLSRSRTPPRSGPAASARRPPRRAAMLERCADVRLQPSLAEGDRSRVHAGCDDALSERRTLPRCRRAGQRDRDRPAPARPSR